MAKVLIPLAQGCEELEAVTIIDLLRRAGIEVISAGLDAGPVTASRGVVLIPDVTLDSVRTEEYDMVVLPGGQPGTNVLAADTRIADLLVKMATNGKFIAAICAAPKVLAKVGILHKKRATSFPGVLKEMLLTDVEIVDSPVVTDGRVITSRGPGTAIDFALELIEQLAGIKKREEVEAGLVGTR